MRSRPWIAILAIGIVALLVLGFLTKLAVEASPQLQNVIRFKTAFAKDFNDERVEEVSLRKSSRGGGYQLILRSRRDAPLPESQDLDQRIAEYFVEKFPDKDARRLEISYEWVGSMGCEGGAPYRSKEVALLSVREGIEEKVRRDKAAAALLRDHSVSVRTWKREGRDLLVELDLPSSATGDGRSVALRLEPAVREACRAVPYSQLRLVLRRGGDPAAGGSSPLTEEFRFDPRGREVKR
jgi:hypothetical protein